MQKNIPKVSIIDTVKGFLFDGYDSISEKSREYDSDVFETQILNKKVIFMRGEEAARLFYDNSRFSREGASPKLVQKTLFGEGGVQGLDGEAHRHRKAMFMDFMNEASIKKLIEFLNIELDDAIDTWEKAEEIVFFDEINKLIFTAVCNWAAVPFRKESTEEKTEDILNMIEGAGTLGLRHWKGRRSRNKAEEWVENLVRKIRSNSLVVPDGTVIKSISLHRDLNGNLLSEKTAAVEIINIIRPTVAVGRFLAFAATALHEFPEQQQKLRSNQVELAHFAQEVRRYYPFFPIVPAITKMDFEWKSMHFPKETKVFLDLYGTNHHPDIWENPEDFKPERFLNWNENPYTLIPQGGGEYHKHHRCPGEMITLEIMKTGIDFLLNKITYTVPPQNLKVEMNKFPSVPKSRFIMKKVKRK
jgi:fatty-acid peroxygenase